MLDDDGPLCRYCRRPADHSIEREYWPLKLPCVEHEDCRQSPKLGDACSASTYAPKRFRRWVCSSGENLFCEHRARRDCDEWHARVLQEDADRLGRVRVVWDYG